MHSSKSEVAFKNIVRGRKPYCKSRHKLAALLLSSEGTSVDDLNPFLQHELFKLKENEWVVLAFDSHDWRTLAKIQSRKSEALDKSYLTLLTGYILANASRIIDFYERDIKISSALMSDDGEGISRELGQFKADDQQSLFIFRVISAAQAGSKDDLTKYLKKNFKTDWLRKRFLYPLIYHAINSPADEDLNMFLSYVTTGDEQDAERATIKFLLSDDACISEPLSFKAYIALLCHPYDACEMLLNHIELEFANSGAISSHLREALNALSAEIPVSRITAMAGLIDGQSVPLTATATCPDLTQRCKFEPRVTRAIIDFMNTVPSPDETEDDLPETLAALDRMRKSQYPEVTDFDLVLITARRWRFSDAGRMLNALLGSLYMVPRSENVFEVRDLLRLRMFMGEVTPFIISSPGSGLALNRGLVPINARANAEDLCDSAIGTDFKDRMWIKSVHWGLRGFEQRMQVKEWLKAVRRNIRVAPSFLTGIDWSWVDEIISKVRLRPFAGDTSGVYVLLLMQIECQGKDITVLRTAMEPLINGMKLLDFVSWLKSEYGAEATAFVRYFLTPEVIMLLHLEPNETAALAGRVFALESCIRDYGSSELLTLEAFDQESKALTATLLLKNVNAGQFEIPWRIFHRDVATKQKDSYNAYIALAVMSEAESLLSNARMSSPHRYRNGKVINYTFKGLQWPLANLIITIVDDFLQHPSFGLEVLLSTRFRHDSLKREVLRTTVELEECMIEGVGKVTRCKLIDTLSSSLPAAVDNWLNRRMQSHRPDCPDGLFDLIPSQEDMDKLIHNFSEASGFDEIIEHVTAWLRSQLDPQLKKARHVFANEFGQILRDSVKEQHAKVLDEKQFRNHHVELVSTALETALSRRTSELVQWFKGTDGGIRKPLTFGEVKLAADGLFETAIATKAFHATLPSCVDSKCQIAPDKVRLCFDLISEIFSNALNNSTGSIARVHITPTSSNGLSGFIFSNLAPMSPVDVKHIKGARYESQSDAIFREGNSGLAKIAALSATLIERDTELVAHRRGRFFHLVVPIWAKDE
ncbi:MAG: hypothetical protein COB46_07875 [Rhodospirillaceae bacterium]|nr:MAG: hypothetical protein COB46_07875 [Rhodospirillaceae bacterium]